MTFSIVRSDRADAEIDAAVFWQVGRDPRRADRWYLGLKEALASLAEMPTRCPIAAESAHFDATVRCLRYQDHRILFRLSDSDGDGMDDTVEVLTVRHVAQGPLFPSNEED